MKTSFTLQSGGLVNFDDPWLLHFEAEDGSAEDWGRLEDEDELHATYQRNGSPYVVTKYEPKEPPAWWQWRFEGDCPALTVVGYEDHLDPHPSLTVPERNPSLH